MPSVGESYKCGLCGNVVEVKEASGKKLACCDETMKITVFKENVWMSVGTGESSND